MFNTGHLLSQVLSRIRPDHRLQRLFAAYRHFSLCTNRTSDSGSYGAFDGQAYYRGSFSPFSPSTALNSHPPAPPSTFSGSSVAATPDTTLSSSLPTTAERSFSDSNVYEAYVPASPSPFRRNPSSSRLLTDLSISFDKKVNVLDQPGAGSPVSTVFDARFQSPSIAGFQKPGLKHDKVRFASQDHEYTHASTDGRVVSISSGQQTSPSPASTLQAASEAAINTRYLLVSGFPVDADLDLKEMLETFKVGQD